jgi:RNAse (barnase) inhibitor barstar
MMTVRIDARRILDEKSFHDIFASHFGFPDTYGRNLDAWVDCMGDLKPTGGVVALRLDHVDDFARRCPKLFENLLNCCAMVNFRQIEAGHSSPILALAYHSG